MEKKWYVVNTYSGHENKVKEKLEMRAESMIMTDDAWYIVRNTPGVTGFIGSSGKGAKPTPLQPYEVDKILGNMGISRIDVDNELEVGLKVKIVSGPFNGMIGKIESIDLPNQKVMLLVDLFGQETSVEVELNQIEKM